MISRSRNTWIQSPLIQSCVEKININVENLIKAFEEATILKQLDFE